MTATARTETPTQRTAGKLVAAAHEHGLAVAALGPEALVEVADGWLILDPTSRRPLRHTSSAPAYAAYMAGDSDHRPAIRSLTRRDAAYRLATAIRGAA